MNLCSSRYLPGTLELDWKANYIRYTNPAGYLFFLASSSFNHLLSHADLAEAGPSSLWFEGGVT